MYYHHGRCKKSCEFIIYYCWWNILLRIGADWCQDNIIIIKTKHIPVYIACLAAPVKRAQRIELPEAGDKKEHDKVKTTKNRIPATLTYSHRRGFRKRFYKQDSCEPSLSKFFTTQYQQHVPCGSSIYVKYGDGQYFKKTQVNMGDDVVEKF